MQLSAERIQEGKKVTFTLAHAGNVARRSLLLHYGHSHYFAAKAFFRTQSYGYFSSSHPIMKTASSLFKNFISSGTTTLRYSGSVKIS